MNRFLICSYPGTGHLYPFIPLAKQLVQQGHQVAWLTTRAFQTEIEATGAYFHPIPSEIDPSIHSRDVLYPEWKKLSGLAMAKYIVKISLDQVSHILHTIDKILEDFPAQVIVSDSMVYAPYIKTEMGGPPTVLFNFVPLGIASRDTAPYGMGLTPGKTLFERQKNRLLTWLAGHILLRDLTTHANYIRCTLNLPPLQNTFFEAAYLLPTRVLHASTPAFEYPRRDLPANVQFVGPLLPEQLPTFEPPTWWPDLSQIKPVILVNQGTVATDVNDLIFPTIQAFKDESVLIIAVPVTVGQIDPLPENVRAEKFIPFANLLPFVDIVVTNGGFGGVQAALAHGIPIVVAGDTEDKMEVSARVEWSGSGINLRKKQPNPDEVRQAVQEVLKNPVYKANARRIQADFARYDTLSIVTQTLEELVK